MTSHQVKQCLVMANGLTLYGDLKVSALINRTHDAKLCDSVKGAHSTLLLAFADVS